GGVRVDGAAAGGKGAAAATDYPRPSLRGDAVFVAGGKRLVEVDRAEGRARHEADLGTEFDPKDGRVVVGMSELVVDTAGRGRGGGCGGRGRQGGARGARGVSPPPPGVALGGGAGIAEATRPPGARVRARGAGAGDEGTPPARPSAPGEYWEAKGPPRTAG